MRPCSCRPHLNCGAGGCDIRKFVDTQPPPSGKSLKKKAAELLDAFHGTPAPNSDIPGGCKQCSPRITQEIRTILANPTGSCTLQESDHV